MFTRAMSDFETIQNAVRIAANRRRWLRGWRGFWQGLFAGALLWLLALGCYKLFPVRFEITFIAALVGIVFSIRNS